MDTCELFIDSPGLKYSENYLEAEYTYSFNRVEQVGPKIIVKPCSRLLNIRTDRRIPKLGVMLVGLGGNNGTTFTAGILANKHGIRWNNKRGEQTPNWFGSITQCSTVNMGYNENNEPVYVPLGNILPMVSANDIAIDGWDISSMNLADAAKRAQVLDYDLQEKIRPYLAKFTPRASIYDPDFIAANQRERANNVLQGTKWDQLQQIQADIRDFKSRENLDRIIVLWTANTEKYADVLRDVNDTDENLMKAIKSDSANIAPSTIFAVASILENCPFINGSPQNTLVPGCIQLAERHGCFIAGDDFKSGQTKLKSVLVDFLVSAGIKPLSIVSYNHLGNNDGRNLSSPQQFRSKEVSKSNVVDDIIRSNSILYGQDESPDHCVVIKYIPTVGDSKRAMDEYTSELMLGGRNVLVLHNTCEDSLLAAPIILDLVLITEMLGRISLRESNYSYTALHPILSVLGYLCKAPLVPQSTPIVNSLFRQRACIENIFRACLSLPPESNMLLEFKIRGFLERLSERNGT